MNSFLLVINLLTLIIFKNLGNIILYSGDFSSDSSSLLQNLFFKNTKLFLWLITD